jgi:protein subunit release factor B
MACPGVLVIDDAHGIGVLVTTERSQIRNKQKAETLLDWAIELTKEHGK